MRLLSYARLSSDDPPGVEKIPAQHAQNRAWLAEQGHDCAGELQDDGISGYYDQRFRPGFAELIRILERHEADGVVARDIDRLARHADLIGHLMTVARVAGAAVHTRLDDIADKHARRAKAAAGEQYVERTRELVTAAKEEQAKEGAYAGGRCVFGLRWERAVPPEEALRMRARRQRPPYRRVVESSEAARLLQASELIESGSSIRAAALSIGIRPARLMDALRNPGLAGAHCYGRTRTIPGTPMRTRSGAPPLILWGMHPEIIPRDRWEALQGRLDEARDHWGRKRGVGTVPLSGQLVCGICGGPVRIYAAPRGGSGHRYRYARCETGRCTHAEVSRWPGPILAAVAERLATEELATAIAAGWAAAHQSGVRRGHAEAELARLSRAERAILDLAGDGTIDAGETRRRLEPIRRQSEAQRHTLAHDRSSARWLTPGQIRDALLRAATRAWEASLDPESYRSALRLLLSEVRVISPREADLVLRWGEVMPVTPHARTESSVRAWVVRWQAVA